VKIPVIGNGDVVTADDAKRMQQMSGCDGVMIGRGGLGNPWIFQQIHTILFEGQTPAEPSMQERLAVALEHADLEAKYEGETRAVFHMRRIGAWYVAGIPNAAHWRGALARSRTMNEIRENLIGALSSATEFKAVASTLTEGQ
jgi:tRNA-dihydrouridine synthase